MGGAVSNGIAIIALFGAIPFLADIAFGHALGFGLGAKKSYFLALLGLLAVLIAAIELNVLAFSYGLISATREAFSNAQHSGIMSPDQVAREMTLLRAVLITAAAMSVGIGIWRGRNSKRDRASHLSLETKE